MISKGSCLTAMVAVCIMVSIVLNAHAPPPSPSEYQLKAVFLYNFVRFGFIEWPAESFADARAPLILGILGKDPFGDTIDRIAKGKTVKGRKLVIKRFEKIKNLEVCHILFISSSEEKRLATILETLKNLSVLTVGEVKQFAQRGGIINFVIKEKKLHLEINVDAAERAKLKVSSKLLELAEIIKDRRHEEKN